MAKSLRMVQEFRQHRIFDVGPRCPVNGFGWGPVSYLNRTNTSAADYGNDAVPYAGLNPNRGLVVSYSGIYLGTVGHALNFLCAVFFPHDHTKGLIITFKSLKLERNLLHGINPRSSRSYHTLQSRNSWIHQAVIQSRSLECLSIMRNSMAYRSNIVAGRH